MTKEDLSGSAGNTIREMTSSYQTTKDKSEEEEEDSAMAALMKSTDEEIEKL